MTSNFNELKLKTQPTFREIDFTAPGELVLAKLGIDITALSSAEISHEKLAHYIAIKQWLKKYKPSPNASALEQVRGYLEVLHHLCELPTWEPIQFIITISVSINAQASSFSLPLNEYLIFKGLVSNLLESCQEIINIFQDRGYDLSSILLLKARAISDFDRPGACNLIQQVISQLPSSSEKYVEAIAHLGIRQVYAADYQTGILNIKQALPLLDELLNSNFSSEDRLRMINLKSDTLEALAFSAMSQSQFDEAIHLYSETFKLRKDNQLVYKIVSPLVHLGILNRRKENYEGAIAYLNEALVEAKNIQDENAMRWIAHHLAWVFLNQGKPLLAEEQCKISLDGYKKMEAESGVADSYEQLGFIYIAKGEIEAALEPLEKALNIRKAIGNRHGTASCLMGLALAAWHSRQYLKFIKFLLQGFNAYYQIGVLNRVRFVKIIKLAYVWTVGRLNWTM